MDTTTKDELLMIALDKLTRIEENTRNLARELRNLRASSLGPTAQEEREARILKKMFEEA